MRVVYVKIKNFRGISDGQILLPMHGVLIGDNNTGKTTVLEALDLTLGPDRLNRQPPIDEHDFYQGKYRSETEVNQGVSIDGKDPEMKEGADASEATSDEEFPRIEIEVAITELTQEQKARFGDYIEFWSDVTNNFYECADPSGVDSKPISEALRITFHGWYNPEEDDFEGRTYFTRSISESDTPIAFSKKDKQVCGFLYLRSLRTGSRALSLERGSLLDIILRLKEVRPQMWEDTITTLADYFDRNVGIILSQARKYNVGMVLAHQYLGQLEPKLQEAVAANTAIKFAGGVSARDARTLAPMLYADPTLIESQPKGSFAAHIRGVTPHALPLRFPFGYLERKDRMSGEERQALQDRMRDRYAVHYTALHEREAEPEAADAPDDTPPEPETPKAGQAKKKLKSALPPDDGTAPGESW